MNLTARFRMHKTLGSGGMGVVYEAYDQVRGEVVALKTVRKVDGANLLRFKQEFRALADIESPHLVQLYELFGQGDQWFFTMERIAGKHLLDVVRRQAWTGQPLTGSMPDRTVSLVAGSASLATAVQEFSSDSGIAEEGFGQSLSMLPTTGNFSACHLDRLQRLLPQLVRGLADLHQAGKVHRDIKPSNILVESDTERLVICDFGLVLEHGDRLQRAVSAGQTVGTYAYMSPEQAKGSAVDAATDWYAVGVVLYQALTGQLPFVGDGKDLIGFKSYVTPKRAHELDPKCPRHLSDLADALLSVDPRKRPGADEILRRFGDTSPLATSMTRARKVVRRVAETESLLRLSETESNELSVAYVAGPSGIGKTTLLSEFVRELSGDVVLLRGRCYESESVAYNAFDAIVDQLTSLLSAWPSSHVRDVVPAGAEVLARIFPVVSKVGGFARDATPPSSASRADAFGILRDLLHNIAKRHRVIMIVDDAQWADDDSWAVLRTLMQPPGAPAITLIASFNTDAMVTGSTADDFFAHPPFGLTPERIMLSGFSQSDVFALLPQREQGTDAKQLTEKLLKSSDGNPLVLSEMIQSVIDGHEDTLDLVDIVRRRYETLAEDAKVIAKYITVAHRPVRLAELRHLVKQDDLRNAIAELRFKKLVRTRSGSCVEVVHARVEKALLALFEGEDQRTLHAELAETVTVVAPDDPEAAFRHWQLAGQPDQACAKALEAADAAERAQAFGKAAELLTYVLEHEGGSPAEIRGRIADALVAAGRGPEAASHLLSLAEVSDDAKTSRKLREQAAWELLRAGHMESGLEVLGALLKDVGQRLPRSPKASLLLLGKETARLKLRGYSHGVLDDGDTHSPRSEAADACFAAALCLSHSDGITAAAFTPLSTRLSLATSDRRRIARAYLSEAAYHSAQGPAARLRSKKLIERAAPLVERCTDPWLHIFYDLVDCYWQFQDGNYGVAAHRSEALLTRIAEVGVRDRWVEATAQLYGVWSLCLSGQYNEFRAKIRRHRRQAAGRGDRYAEAVMRIGLSGVDHLLLDEPERQREELEYARRAWDHAGFQLEHFWLALTETSILRYEGRGREAYEKSEALWTALNRSMLTQIHVILCESVANRVRCILAAIPHLSPSEAQAALRQAKASMDRVDRRRDPSIGPGTVVLRGLVAYAEGRKAEAVLHLAEGESQLLARGGRTNAAAAAYRRAQILGVEPLRLQAEAVLKSEGICHVERWLGFEAPLRLKDH